MTQGKEMYHLIMCVLPSHSIVAAVCQLHQNLCPAKIHIFNLSESQITGISEGASKTGDQFCKSYFIKISDGYIRS